MDYKNLSKFIPFAIIPIPEKPLMSGPQYKGKPDLPLEPFTHLEDMYMNTIGFPK